MAGVTLPGIEGTWYRYDEDVVFERVTDTETGIQTLVPLANIPFTVQAPDGTPWTPRSTAAPYAVLEQTVVTPGALPTMYLPGRHRVVYAGGLTFEADHSDLYSEVEELFTLVQQLRDDHEALKADVEAGGGTGGGTTGPGGGYYFPVDYDVDAGAWPYLTLEAAVEAGFDPNTQIAVFRGPVGVVDQPNPAPWFREGRDEHHRAGALAA